MRRLVVAVVLSGLVLAACAQDEPAVGTGDETESPAADACEKDSLQLLQPGVLTIGTDNPAFPPWFEGGTSDDSPWEINDPSTGEGFESAVAYAVADRLGFSHDEVEWVEVPFNQSFKPGPKEFDFFINQVSITEKRAQNVDFSEGYYDVNQALVSVEGNDLADATTLEELKGFKLAAPIGTTSFDYIEQTIQPDEEPAVFDTLNDAVTALNNGQVDGVVVDLPTAFFIVAVQVDNGVIVGQFPNLGGEQEQFGMVLEKDSPLTECVSGAVAELKADGTLESIQQEWLADKASAPVIAG
jgi:polar amino acid transport system substrate-binding protein